MGKQVDWLGLTKVLWHKGGNYSVVGQKAVAMYGYPGGYILHLMYDGVPSGGLQMVLHWHIWPSYQS